MTARLVLYRAAWELVRPTRLLQPPPLVRPRALSLQPAAASRALADKTAAASAGALGEFPVGGGGASGRLGAPARQWVGGQGAQHRGALAGGKTRLIFLYSRVGAILACLHICA